MKHGLKDRHLRAILDVIQRHEKVERAVLFGSRAMETHTPDSDVDICLFGDALTLTDHAKIIAAMEELSIPQRVDILLRSNVKEKALLDHIRREGKVILERETTQKKRVERGLGVGGEWRGATLSELLDSGDASLQTGPFGTALKAAEYSNAGVPLISVREIREGYLTIGPETPRVNNQTIERLPQFVLQTGDIVFGRKGGVDRNAIIKEEQDGWFLGSDGIRLRLADSLDSHFFSYQMRSPATRAWLIQNSEGKTMPSLNQKILGRIPIVVPPLREQRAIAHILGTLDDKIELNRRTNETLETMARALFKSWFVDFDPVRAKAEGETPPGMDAATTALFPSKFHDSELGEIPKGWRTTTLGAEAERYGGIVQTGPFGSQLHASDYVPEGIPVVMPKDIAGRRVSTESIARIREADAERLSKHRLQPGDLVYSRRGDVERHALVADRETGWLCGTGCLLVRLGPRWPSPAFASFALDRPEARAWICQHAVGATMPNLNTSILSAVPLVVPSDELLAAFGREVDRLERLHVSRDAESMTLAKLRDALLPRLLSGELSVANTERAVEAMV